MRKLLLLLAGLSAFFSVAQTPLCDSVLYNLSANGQSVHVARLGLPVNASLTPITMPTTPIGFAIGRGFGLTNAPDPTFWTTSGGTYWYYDGTTFINTNHTSNTSVGSIGGSSRYLYHVSQATGDVYRYNGSGNATFLFAVPVPTFGMFDLACDDRENIYIMNAMAALRVFDSTGVETCSYSINGIPAAPATVGGFAINGNTVTVRLPSGMYVGTFSGSAINFTQAPVAGIPQSNDMASCYFATSFTAFISASPSTVISCTNPTITLTAVADAPQLTYAWEGPGILTPTNNISVDANMPGIYSCTITSCSGASAIAAFSLGEEVISIGHTGHISCTNQTSKLTAAVNSASSVILWTGPGIAGSDSTASIFIISAGVYSIAVTNTITNCVSSGSIEILSSVGPLTLNIVPSATVRCEPGPAVNMLVNASANFTWSPADGLDDVNSPVVAANPTVTTTYSLYAEQGICSGSAVITISVIPTPTISVALLQDSICSGNTTTLTVNGATTYSWFPGNIPDSVAVISPVGTLVYTVTGANRHCTDVRQLTVNVKPSPQLNPVAIPSVICSGNAAVLSSTDALSYSWSPGGSTQNSVNVTPLNSEVYTVSGINAFGCSSSATVMLKVNQTPTINASASTTVICKGEQVTLYSSGSSHNVWMPFQLRLDTITDSPQATITYSVRGENAGCRDTAHVTIVVLDCNTMIGLANSASEPKLILGNYYQIDFTVTVANTGTIALDSLTIEEDFTTLFPSGVSYTMYQKPSVENSNSTIVPNTSFDGVTDKRLVLQQSFLNAKTSERIIYSLLIQPGAGGEFSQSLTASALALKSKQLTDISQNGLNVDPDKNGNPTDNNEPTPIVLKEINLFIPEGLSPNGDGRYDNLIIKGLNGRKANFTVFNRWGNRVYVTTGSEIIWDGYSNVSTMGGGLLPEGTYYYVLEFIEGPADKKTGFIVLRY